MKKTDKIKVEKWYDNAKFVTSMIIFLIFMIIVCSQSFAVVGNSSSQLFRSVINHNTTYLLVLIYFVGLKTYIGKKYFNYLNVFLIIVYFILSFTSILTIVQSFSLNTIFSFLINMVLLIYLFHTMFRDTRIWKEFKLGRSPFNSIQNDYYFNCLLILVTMSLFVNLISTVVVSGLIVSILDAFYISLFARYIYLYRSYLDLKKKDIDNSGNFDQIIHEIDDGFNEIKDAALDISEKVKSDTLKELSSEKAKFNKKNDTQNITNKKGEK